MGVSVVLLRQGLELFFPETQGLVGWGVPEDDSHEGREEGVDKMAASDDGELNPISVERPIPCFDFLPEADLTVTEVHHETTNAKVPVDPSQEFCHGASTILWHRYG